MPVNATAPPKIVVEAKLLRKSPFQNPKTAPYDASLYAADYEMDPAITGAASWAEEPPPARVPE